jgi:hypothetical protein
MPAEELTFAEKIRTLQFNTGRSKPVRREPVDENGRRMRTVERPTDSGAHVTVTNRSSDRGDHQDVRVDMPLVRRSQ